MNAYVDFVIQSKARLRIRSLGNYSHRLMDTALGNTPLKACLNLKYPEGFVVRILNCRVKHSTEAQKATLVHTSSCPATWGSTGASPTPTCLINNFALVQDAM